MAIMYKSDSFILLDHASFINHLYKCISDGEDIRVYEFLRHLFSIQNVGKKGSRKRSHGADNFLDETIQVKQMYEQFLLELPTKYKSLISSYSLSDTSTVRDLAKKLFESTLFEHTGINGGNNSGTPLKCKIKDESFLLPSNSRFLCGCVKEQCQKLVGCQFDILIADPPWWNKYIRRLKRANDKLSYSMMYNEDIASIPVKHLLSPNCLVAVWCTNAPSNIATVKNTIFPSWGVTYVTTWYWLKVTVDLQPLCQFGSGLMKQPYERVMIGKVGEVEVPESLLLVSVPSALHSHKPPLLDILTPLLKAENPQTLELFARYLLPNTTSVGYEPLKWQHISLYENVTKSDDNDDDLEINDR